MDKRLDNYYISEVIKKHDLELAELREELPKIQSKSAQQAIKHQISYLEDNKYRYGMQFDANKRAGL